MISKGISMDIRLKEVLVNLKNYDYDIHGPYQMDETEARKLIETLEEIYIDTDM